MFLPWIVIYTKDAEMDTYISKIKTGDFLFELGQNYFLFLINVLPGNLGGLVFVMKNVTCWSILSVIKC